MEIKGVNDLSLPNFQKTFKDDLNYEDVLNLLKDELSKENESYLLETFYKLTFFSHDVRQIIVLKLEKLAISYKLCQIFGIQDQCEIEKIADRLPDWLVIREYEVI